MNKIKEIVQHLSPILFKSSSDSITISLSRRFFLFNLLAKFTEAIENDPYLNFISLLKNYKILGRILSGKIKDLHRDRNKMYFKNFFPDKELYDIVKADIEDIFKINQELNITITRRGLIIYDNYQKNQFNVLLLTIHNGSWVPSRIEKKLDLTKTFRYSEEDVETSKLYRSLVLEKGGIWLDNKQSRFACDYNRKPHRVIYHQNSEKWISKKVWKEELTQHEITGIMKGYREFYFTLARLVDAYRFNIIFDGHSMKDAPGRPNMSFGTKYIPKFYGPIVKSMQKNLIRQKYGPVFIDYPYVGGNILRWLSTKFPDVFIFSMEVNKKLYMNKSRTQAYKRKINKISEDIKNILNIEIE